VRELLRSGFVRGLALIALVSAVIVAFSLEESLVTARALVSVGFFLAIAFFLFLLWRERRSEIETWAAISRAAFFGAVALAVADVAAFVVLDPRGVDAVVFLLVLAACAFAVLRVWRRERTLV
jgi:small-conductance mechanosensitive channel